MLSVRIRKSLPGFALDVSWEAPEEVVALVGPSGSGKTLTLHCLAGLVRPDEGRIRFDDDVLFDAATGVDRPPRGRRLGYVFQGYALFPHLTVRANIAYGLRDWERSARRARVATLVERLGLEKLEERRPFELSGGQQQRVALARALAIDPALLLLDEPLSALDAPLRRQLRDELLQTIRDWGKATVLVTHDLSEAYQLADRVVVYDQGRVLQSASRSDLLWRPASEAVARITGMRNILSGTVVKVAPDRIWIGWRDMVLEAANVPRHPYLPATGSRIAFLVQPDNVRLIRKDRPEGESDRFTNVMSGTVVRQTDLGLTWALAFRLDQPGEPAQGHFDLEIEVSRLVFEMLRLDEDHRWRATVNPSAVQVLPSREADDR